MIKTHQVKIKPNKVMKQWIHELFAYRRWCWNYGLSLWNDFYEESLIFEDKTLRPNGNKVRNFMVSRKNDWQYLYSSRVLQIAIIDLEKAWKNFFNPEMPDHKRPKFKSKRDENEATFSTDQAKIIDGKLVLAKPQLVSKSEWFPIKMCEKLRFDYEEGIYLKMVTITKKNDGYYASIVVETEHEVVKPEKDEVCGVDANVHNFNYNDGQIEDIFPDKLKALYKQIKYYDRVMSRKRRENPNYYNSKRYLRAKAKRAALYKRVHDLQHDLVHKFTTCLVHEYREIHIEDLNNKAMKMGRASKGLHNSLFGQFKEIMKYKADWNQNTLVLAPQTYPSTQTCSECGYVKTKNSYGGKHGLGGDGIYHDHQTYRCYECGAVMDRDENAVQNLINYQPQHEV